MTRKYGLDFLKGIAACFVVFMHARFPEMTGYYVAMLGRAAVPIFFLTSGYFAFGASKSKIIRSIKRTLSYLLVAYVLGVIGILVTYHFDFSRFGELLAHRILTTDHFLRLVFLADTRLCGVAWFLLSLLYCYVLKYYFGRKLRYIAYIGIFFRIIGAIQYPFFSITVPVNTPWITGIPFFILGDLICEYENNLKKYLPSSKCASLGGIGLLILVVPFFHGALWWVIGTLLFSPSLFVFFLRIDMPFNKFCLLGSTYAFFIYIVHPLVMHTYDALRVNPSINEMWARPVIVLVTTVLLAVIYYSAKSWGRVKGELTN